MAEDEILLFDEVQSFSGQLWLAICGFVTATIAIAMVAMPPDQRGTGLMVMILIVGVLVLFRHWFRLTTRIDRIAIEVRFPLGLGRRIVLTDIAEATAITYRPLADFGGWGIRFGSQGTIYSTAGNRAVRLVTRDGARVLIGSARPEALLDALGHASR